MNTNIEMDGLCYTFVVVVVLNEEFNEHGHCYPFCLFVVLSKKEEEVDEEEEEVLTPNTSHLYNIIGVCNR